MKPTFLYLGLLTPCLAMCQPAQNGQSTEPPDALTGEEVLPDINWLHIENGTFTFGSPEDTPCRSPGIEDQVSVTLTRSFLMAATEVTQSQWEALDLPQSSWTIGPDLPVTRINFFEALVWCNKLSTLEGLDTCYDLTSCNNAVGTGCVIDESHTGEACSDPEVVFSCTGNIHKFADYYSCPGYRLPTTAEWEYAAKAGVTDTHTYGGDVHADVSLGSCSEQPALEDIAWYCNNSGDEVHPVGQKLPNPWGLYDTLGNVEEWVDYYDMDQPLGGWDAGELLIDPTGPTSGQWGQQRGSNYSDYSAGCLVRPAWQAVRENYQRAKYSGFRPVRTIFE